MTPTTKRHMQLILDLVACYADHPEKIKFTQAEAGVRANGVPAEVYWRMQAASEDHGKLAGRGGANVHALQFVVAELGIAADSEYHFQLVSPITPPPERRADTAPAIVENYDCAPLVALIGRLVTEIASREFTVTAAGVVPGRDVLTHRLTVAFQDQDDHDYFHEDVCEHVNQLLRAMQRKQGALCEVACVMAKKAVGAK